MFDFKAKVQHVDNGVQVLTLDGWGFWTDQPVLMELVVSGLDFVSQLDFASGDEAVGVVPGELDWLLAELE